MRYVGKKLLQLIPVLLVVSAATFLLLNLLPGDPTTAILGANASEEGKAQLEKELNLDEPLPVQYGKWLGNAVTGDLGRSYLPGGEEVGPAIWSRLPLTLELLLLAQIFALLLAIPAAIFSAYRAGGVFDKVSTTGAFGLLSIPSFMMGVLLIFFFAVRFPWFNATGYTPLSEDVGENLKSMVLPALTLALAEMAVYLRVLRTDMDATLQEDFIQMAKAKGLPTRRILLRHALRPSTFSLITIIGLNIGALIGGAIVVERLFALNGIGALTVGAISRRDYIMVQGCVLVVAVGYVLINFAVDMLYAVLDPRIRHARAAA